MGLFFYRKTVPRSNIGENPIILVSMLVFQVYRRRIYQRPPFLDQITLCSCSADDSLGIVLAFLRLDHQVKSLGVGSQDFHQLAIERILPEGPDVPILHERVSPFGSSSALAGPILRILASRDLKTIVPGDDTACIQEAMRIALTNGHMVSHGGSLMGSDEVLFGRAGLLWALLNLRLRTYEDETAQALTLVFKEIPRLVDRIIASGIDGREDFISKHGEQYALPLMWHWKEDRYSLGALVFSQLMFLQ